MAESDTNPPTDFEALAARVIDQAVADGELARGHAVTIQWLSKTAFLGFQQSEATLSGFKAALEADPRLLGLDGDNYNFEDQMSPGSEVKPSMRAMVAGTAKCTVEERAEVLGMMDLLVHAIHRFYDPVRSRWPGISNMHQIRGLLKHNGIDLDRNVSAALIEYIRRDSRFHVLPDKRIVILGFFTGDVEGIKPLEPITNIRAAVDEVIATISPRSPFTLARVMRHLHNSGYMSGPDMAREVGAVLNRHPRLALTAEGKYVLKGPKRDSP